MEELKEIQEVAQDLRSMKQPDETIAVLNQETAPIPLIPIKELPSGFKGYPKGTKISFKPITLGELESLNSGDIDVTRATAMLLKAIDCNTIPPEDLAYWDVMYIGIKRKLLAFGDTKGTIRARCPKCGTIVAKAFSSSELEFRELDVPALPMKLQIMDKPIEFGLITMKDMLEFQLEEGERGIYARMMKNIPFEEAYQICSNAYGLDIKKLRFVDEKLNYGLKPFHVNCPGTVEVPNPDFNPEQPESKTNKPFIDEVCGEQVVVEVVSPFELVFPEDGDSEDLGFEVQYG